MGRPVQIRASFTRDAQFLMRLKAAIEKDSTRPAEWKREAIEQIDALAVTLLQAPEKSKPALLKKKAAK